MKINFIKNFLKLFIYRFKKINDKQWLFYSHNGGYSDNSKAVSESVHMLYDDIKIVWAVSKKYNDIIPKYAKTVDFDSENFLLERARSKVIIDNVYADSVEYLLKNDIFGNIKKIIKLWLKRKNQKTYGLWHGTPLKRMGKDQIGNDDYLNCIANDLTIIDGDTFTSKILCHLTFDKIECKTLGLARNDVLFSNVDKELSKSRLSIPKGKKVLLYAPTFRNDGKDCENRNIYRSGINQLNELDINKILKMCSEKFGGEWVFVCRFHYHVSSLVDWESLEKQYNGMVINGNLSDDMADYLQVTDVLLTDYSSVMFDFSLTKNPCFLYVDDLENYKNNERGFYIDINALPYPLAKSCDELIDNIIKFDSEEYEIGVNELLEKFGNKNDGKSSERIAKYIYKDVYGA